MPQAGAVVSDGSAHPLPSPKPRGLVSLDWSFRQFGFRVKWKKIWWEPL